MRHEPSGPCLSVQLVTDRPCPSCRTVKPLEDFPARAGTPTGCCTPCQRRKAAITHRHRQRTLQQVARRAEAGYRALLAEVQGGGGDAA